MKKKEILNILTTLAVIFLMGGQFAIYLFIGISDIIINESFYNIAESMYLTYAALLMIYMVFFIGLEEKGNRLYCRKKLLKNNIFAIIAVEMFLFMITFINDLIYHLDSYYDGIFVIYAVYISVMIIFAVIAYILRERRRIHNDD